jgi:hypothetical protein
MHATSMLRRLFSENCLCIRKKWLTTLCAATDAAVSGCPLTLSDLGRGSAKLNGIEPEAYLRHLLTHITAYPINRIDELLPWKLAGQLPAMTPTA